MVATRKNTARPKAVVATIDKSEALALIRSGEVDKVNKYRRPCHLCGEIVPAEEGVLGGNKTEGWWAAHKDGACFKPAPAPKVNRRKPTPRKADEFDEMVEAVKQEAAKTRRGSASASKKVAADSESAAKVDEANVPVRGKRNSTMVAAKKTVARRSTKRAAAAPAPAAKTTPRKRTAPKKVTPNLPKEEATESASASDEEGPEFAELDAAAQQLVNAFIERIADGTLDGALAALDDAITSRLDAVEAASKPAKKTTARKSTTTKSAADKVAPVKRAAKGAGSASASKPSTEKEVEIVKVPRPRKGHDYMINPKLKNKMAGLKITFKSYTPDSDNKKANITIREEYNGKPAGTRFIIPVSSIVQDN